MSALASEINSLPLYALVLALECVEEDYGRMLQMGLASSQAQHKPACSLAVYRKYLGSEQKIYVLAPLQPTPETQQGSGLPKQSLGLEVLETLMDGLKTSESFIATYIPELSNPPTGNQLEPSPYAQLISATIKPNLAESQTKVAREAAKKIVAAHQQNTKGRRFITYHSYNTADDVFHIIVPLNSLVELDDPVDNRELAQEMYGADEAARLLEAINQVVVESASCVAEYHPVISAIL